MAEFALGLGSNLGNRMNNLLEGVRFILSRSMMGRFRLSGVYETPPIENVEGEDFLNCVMVGNFFGSVDELMRNCREAEILLGSMVRKNNAPRTLDVDILFFENISRDDDALRLPHPGIGRRKFILKPLSEVWEQKVPGLKKTPEELLQKCPDKSRITKLLEAPVSGCFWEVDN